MANDDELFKKFDAFLTEREKREAERKDPKKRFELNMERLEAFLDKQDEGNKKAKPSDKKANEDDAGFLDSIFGAKS